MTKRDKCEICRDHADDETQNAHDCVAGICPKCGACTDTVWETWDRARGTYTYVVQAHGRMGNKSYRDDTEVGVICHDCGYKTPLPTSD